MRPNGGEPPEVLVSGRGRSLLLWRMGAGAPRSVDDDNRDRLGLPDWLRRLAGSDGPVLVSTSEPEAAMGVVTPDAVLDVMVDELVGEVR